MVVKPFRGLRPRQELAARIASLPYDVMSREEALRLAGTNPYSFLRVTRAEIELDPAISAYDERVYAKSRENFRAMVDRGWLVRDATPAHYVYRLRMGGQAQTGIVGAAAVDDYRGGRIKRHEQTRPDKVEDRLRVLRAIEAHPGPVFLAHRPDPALAVVVATIVTAPPAASFIAADGIEHELWVASDPALRAAIESRFAAMPATYVADGHHRAAAAAEACEAAARDGLATRPEASTNFFLAVHFPSNELRVLDYNRTVRDLGGLTPQAFLERARDAGFEIVADHPAKRPPARGTFGVYLDGRWHLLRARPQIVSGKDALGRLDVSLLSEHLLGPVLGILDPRTDGRIDFVGGVRGMDELERRVDAGEAAVAFALYPTSLDDVMQVADAGGVMPPKSTWFEPKLRSGLVVQPFDRDDL